MPEFLYGSGPPKPVPPMKPEQIEGSVSLVRPLSRKGVGPGMIILAPEEPRSMAVDIEDGIPSLRMKWAEEGYCVVEIRGKASSSALKTAVAKLSECAECEPRENMGLICYDTGMWKELAPAIDSLKDRIVVAGIYAQASEYSALTAQTSIPTIYHLTGAAETKLKRLPGSKVYEYGSSRDSTFAVPFHKDFHYATEAVSHSRNLAFFKPVMGGPWFDLELIWEEHTYYEFEAREVENTMTTMVQEPYVNHIPTITGGIGRANLTNFYRDHFIFSNPADTELELISRTTGIDRVVDEFIYKFTHDQTIDWLFPGVPPTYKYVEIPMMAVVNVRGDRLYHEHITWDSATALRQIGALGERVELVVDGNPKLANGTNGHVNGNGHAVGGKKKFEIVLPTTGTDTVAKMRDKNSVESNVMFGNQVREL